MQAPAVAPRILAAGVAAAGTLIGGASLLAAGPVARASGMPDDARSLWALRLFGVRDLVLGGALAARLARRRQAEVRLLMALVAATQVGDLLVTAVALRRDGVSRRAALAVALGAPATVAAAAAVLWPRASVRAHIRGMRGSLYVGGTESAAAGERTGAGRRIDSQPAPE